MNFVVDSNVLFTFFWKSSVFEDISSREKITLFSPEFALEELDKYSSEIIRKSGLTKERFDRRKRELAEKVSFIPLDEYSDLFKQAESLANKFSKEQKTEFLEDIDFFTLALKLDCPIWTNDRLFKRQSEVSVLTTKEMIELLS